MVTVRWLLAQRRLGLTMLAGERGLDAPISLVATTELTDPTRWLSGGEMVLTTGIAVPPDADGRRDYVRRLADYGISALGYGVGISSAAAPRELVAAAEEAGLPLLEVPLPTPFVAVARAVVDESGRQQSQAQRDTARAQQRMTRAAVRGGPSGTLRELAAGIGGRAVLLDRDGRPVHSHPAVDDPELLDAVGAQVLRHPDTSAVGPAGDGVVITQEIRVGARRHGYLAVALDRPSAPTDHVLIGSANSLLALEFEKPHQMRATQRRMHTAALQLLMSAGADLGEVTRLVSEAADRGGVRALVLRVPADRVDDVAAELDRRLGAAARPVFLQEARDDGEVVAVLRAGDDAEFAGRLVDGVAPALRRRLLLGLSTPHPVEALPAAVAEARLASRAGHPGGPPVDAATLVGRTLLTDDAARSALERLAGSLLSPLRTDPDPQAAELLRSLRAFLEHHGQWESAAAAAGVHRHTLRARIARIEELLDVDLRSARVRAELLLALLASDGG